MPRRAALRARTAMAAVAAVLATGCASAPKPLYGWENYQPQVYTYLKSHGEASPEPQIAALEEAEQKVRARGEVLPPGYQAHLALLYAKAGQSSKSAERLAAEKAQFPESAPFMNFLSRTFAGGKGAAE